MAGRQSVHFGIGQILEERFATFGREKGVILAPEYDRLRLLFPKESLPHRIEFDVGAVVIKEVELHPASVRALHEGEVGFPVVRADQFRILRAVQVHSLDCVVLEEGRQRGFVFGAPVLPKRSPEAVPGFRETDFVSVAVLDGQPFQSVRVPRDHPEADRAAIVLNEQTVAIKTTTAEKGLRNLGEFVEGVSKACRIGHVAVSETRIIGRDHVKTSGQRRNQIPILMGRCGKSMQQDQLRAARSTGLPVGDIQALDNGGAVEDLRCVHDRSLFAAGL